MALEIRTITDDEVPQFHATLMATFGNDANDADPHGAARLRALVPTSQAWAAFDRGQVVATAATFDHQLGVPGGGSLPMAGLTMVTVRPTHRRRGLLSALLQRHLDDARARGFASSGLWASEAGIYGRFGYGIAAHGDAIEIVDAPTVTVAAGRELDEVAWLEEPQARALLPAIYARATAQRPGALRRSEVWWRERRFLEAPYVRAGASRRRHVVARRDGELVGYVAYRQRGGFAAGASDGKVEISELVAVDPRAEATLWRYALAVDLFPRVTWWNAPVDDTLAWLVPDPRRVQRRRTDTLWLRIDDVAATLAARRYEADGTLRLAIDATTWQLVVEDGHGRVTATAGAPEVRLTRQALGAAYLGGVPLTQLARAELAHGDPAALATADRLFHSAIAPWCPEVF